MACLSADQPPGRPDDVQRASAHYALSTAVAGYHSGRFCMRQCWPAVILEGGMERGRACTAEQAGPYF